jgi:branched-chain amino acid transport system substrate-binding protein
MGNRFLVSIFLCLTLLVISVPGNGYAQESKDVITVGAVVALTGPLSFAGAPLGEGLKDALMMANEAGGVGGKKLQYVAEDSQYKLDLAKPAFIRIMDKYKPLAMYGDSTALGEALAPDISNRYKVLYSSTSFSGSLAFASANSSIFVPGPTYGDQFAILIKYIAAQKPGAKVAFFYSDSAYGKEPLKYGRWMCDRMKLRLVAEEVTKIGETEVSAQVKNLKDKDPDYVIFHGFVGGQPIPTVVKLARESGMACQFMGTFWECHETLLDKLGQYGEGYLGISPYCYWSMEDVPMIKKIRNYNAQHFPDVKYRPAAYMQGFATGLIFVEVLKRADKAKKLDFDGMVEALHSLKDFETEGLTAPLTILNNRFPVGRIWKANKGIFEPASDWIKVR